MAAPGRIEDPNWHRSRELPQECEWKQGESARGKKTFLRRQEGGRSWRLPLVGEAVVRFAVPEKVLTRPAFSWKPRPRGSEFRVSSVLCRAGFRGSRGPSRGMTPSS